MIVVVANGWDEIARTFASRWAAPDIRVLTSQDLSAVGWRRHLNGAQDRTAVVEKQVVSQEEISGVITRIPCVVREELVDIVPEDRAYVAAEMTAFLLFWLSSLQCPVVNRPASLCLSGPCWRQESWIRLAVDVGIPVQPLHRQARLQARPRQESDQPIATVTVIGECTFGETDPVLHRHARQLADAAGIQVLVARFSHSERGARFVSADVYPDLSEDAIAQAMLDCLDQVSRAHA